MTTSANSYLSDYKQAADEQVEYAKEVLYSNGESRERHGKRADSLPALQLPFTASCAGRATCTRTCCELTLREESSRNTRRYA